MINTGLKINKIKQILMYLLLFIFASGIFFSLKEYRRPGGDSDEMIHLVKTNSQYMYYYRSPGIFWMHQTIFFLFKDYGLRAEDAIAISSATAGGLFVCVLLSLSFNPLFLFIALFSGINFIFMGHIENYGWVNALIALFIQRGVRYLEGRGSFTSCALVWVSACFMHMVAVFYFPAVFYIFLNPYKEDISDYRGFSHKYINLPDRKDIEKSLSIIIFFLLIITFLPMVLKNRIMMLDVGSLRLVPLFRISNPRHYFTMFSIEHLKIMLYFIYKASVFGIPLLIITCTKINRRYGIFILTAFLSGFLWAFIWHPDMGLSDWDLFGTFAVPLNILNGLTVASLVPFNNFEKKIRSLLN